MFLAPWLLLGLAAAAIPLILHLRRSTKVRKITFSTTRFFDEQFIRSSRRARLQDRLLMAMRIALLCLFVLALAQPLIKLPWLNALAGIGGGKRSVAIVLDDSASMGAVTGRGVLLDRAKAGALSVLDGLSSSRGDRATVVLAGRREAGVKVLFEQPTTDLQAVKDAVRAVQVTDLATDVTAAVEQAQHVLGVLAPGATAAEAPPAGGGDREVYVFSDLQDSSLAFDPDTPLDSRTGVFFVSTRPTDADAKNNISVDAIQYGAPRPMLGVPFTFRALITNHSDKPVTPSISLVIDGQTSRHKPMEVPAGRSKIVRFVHRFTKAGWYGGSVEVNPAGVAGEDAGVGINDILTADNRRFFAVQVQDKVRVLAINGAPSEVASRDELFFLRLALTVNPQAADAAGTPGKPSGGGVTAPPIRVDTANPVEVTPTKLEDYRLVVLANVANLSPESLEALEHYVDAGGNLLVTLGDRISPEFYNNWIGENRLHGGLLPGRLLTLIGNAAPATDGSADQTEEPESSAARNPSAQTQPAAQDAGFIAAVEQGHPALAGFGDDSQLGSLSAVRFTARYGVDPQTSDVLMRAPAGDPLLLEKRFGRGRVMMFTSSIDRDWNNFPLQPSFVPWIYRIVGYLAQSSVENANFIRTGQVAMLPSSTTQMQALQMLSPGGDIGYPGPLPNLPTPPGVAPFAATEKAGLYEVRQSNAPPDAPPQIVLAANIPSDESDGVYDTEKDIAPMMGKQAAWMFVDEPEKIADAGRIARQGFGLWDQLLMLALAVALFEPWLANRLTRKRGAASGDALSQRDVAASPIAPPAAAA